MVFCTRNTISAPQVQANLDWMLVSSGWDIKDNQFPHNGTSDWEHNAPRRLALEKTPPAVRVGSGSWGCSAKHAHSFSFVGSNTAWNAVPRIGDKISLAVMSGFRNPRNLRNMLSTLPSAIIREGDWDSRPRWIKVLLSMKDHMSTPPSPKNHLFWPRRLVQRRVEFVVPRIDLGSLHQKGQRDVIVSVSACQMQRRVFDASFRIKVCSLSDELQNTCIKKRTKMDTAEH